MDKVEFEKKMFKYMEYQRTQAIVKEEMQLLKDYFQTELEKEGMSTYRALFDADFDIEVKIKRDSKKKFDDDKLATDFNTTKSDAKKKEFLIKAAEENKLTLKQFNQYFYYQNEVDVTVKKKKISEREKKQRRG